VHDTVQVAPPLGEREQEPENAPAEEGHERQRQERLDQRERAA
jgi:hypothetical protein